MLNDIKTRIFLVSYSPTNVCASHADHIKNQSYLLGLQNSFTAKINQSHLKIYKLFESLF